MATQTVKLASHPSQVGTKLQLWAIDTLLLVQNVSAVETVAGSGLYTADFTDAPANSYRVLHYASDGDLIWSSCVVLTLSTATFQAHDAAFAAGGGGGGGGDATLANQVIIKADLDDIQTRLPAALQGGRMNAYVGEMGTDTLNASALAADAVAEIQSGLATPINITAGTLTTVTNLTNAPTSGDLTATMKASVTAAVPSVVSIQTGLATPTNITSASGIAVSSIGNNVITALALATDAVNEIQAGLATPTNITSASGIAVSSIGANVITASALATDAVNEIQSGLATPTNITSITGNLSGSVGSVTGAVGSVTGAVGSVTGAVGSVTGAVGSVTGAVTVGTINANVVNASALAADAVAEIQSGLALAATALSTTQWTNTLAANIGTTNTTVATNLDATVSSRLASASYTAPSNLTAAQIATGVWQDANAGDFTTASSVGKSLYHAFTAGTSVFTVAALANAPSGGGGGGGGDATLANQTLIISTLAAIKGAGWDGSTDTLEKIRDAITAYISSAVGSVQSSAGTIVGFPSTLTIGDSYTQDANRAIVVYIRDAANAPILSVGSHNFLDGDFAPELVVTQGGETGRVHATVTYVVPGGILENYLRVEFSPKETRRAGQGAATMQCRLKWTGVQFTLATQAVVWNPSI